MTTNEVQAVALLLERRNGHVHVFSDGSALWSPKPPDPTAYPFADDCPAHIPCSTQSYSYTGARVLYRNAIKSLRLRGVR